MSRLIDPLYCSSAISLFPVRHFTIALSDAACVAAAIQSRHLHDHVWGMPRLVSSFTPGRLLSVWRKALLSSFSNTWRSQATKFFGVPLKASQRDPPRMDLHPYCLLIILGNEPAVCMPSCEFTSVGMQVPPQMYWHLRFPSQEIQLSAILLSEVQQRERAVVSQRQENESLDWQAVLKSS